MKKMRVVLLVDGIDYASRGFAVHDQHVSQVTSLIRERINEIAKDFNVQSSTPKTEAKP